MRPAGLIPASVVALSAKLELQYIFNTWGFKSVTAFD
jgi:hypothetical protein